MVDIFSQLTDTGILQAGALHLKKHKVYGHTHFNTQLCLVQNIANYYFVVINDILPYNLSSVAIT